MWRRSACGQLIKHTRLTRRTSIKVTGSRLKELLFHLVASQQNCECAQLQWVIHSAAKCITGVKANFSQANSCNNFSLSRRSSNNMTHYSQRRTITLWRCCISVRGIKNCIQARYLKVTARLSVIKITAGRRACRWDFINAHRRHGSGKKKLHTIIV